MEQLYTLNVNPLFLTQTNYKIVITDDTELGR